ncbi:MULTISPECIES: LysR family transcriptional regulator [Halomonas]|uniref:LysR family transcriptional regulator n=1 Tax=Halomonas TaxID=2745 RepID=UPI001C94E0CE|nr:MULTISPECIES: LysR family transcriptional regulator [Halomonas]MBY6208687.1 LysR family transcriptional regulator [Halomonas sp. DP3Y7-2]MBY6227158.1 LysR family transcriptional regulator [Halomonas sp. DP3Y7-1]MCA0915093.1 LysR family transcriptional regulator [Halomonas denitrificans]
MDRLQSLKVFIAVAEAESFAEAARRLGMSAPSVTRGVNTLEARLGTRLLIRTTRRVRLTEVGRAYLEDARHVLAQLQAADDAASGAAIRPLGELRLTCPNEFGRRYMTPMLVDFLDAYPDVSVDVVMLDRVVNMVEEGFDVALRIGPLPSSELVAVRVGDVRRVICAAPDYLERWGEPQKPQELKDHRIAAVSALSPIVEWRFGRDEKDTVRISPRLRLSSVAAGIEAACHGWGLTRVLSYQIADELASGRLRVVLQDHEPAPWPIHLVHVEGRRAPAKVRSFVDFARDRLRARLADMLE